jgi:hypothetical protein
VDNFVDRIKKQPSKARHMGLAYGLPQKRANKKTVIKQRVKNIFSSSTFKILVLAPQHSNCV